MKCIKIPAEKIGIKPDHETNGMVVRRVEDTEAFQLVHKSKVGWAYAPRREWKAAGRVDGVPK